jgi:hypothetical protein
MWSFCQSRQADEPPVCGERKIDMDKDAVLEKNESDDTITDAKEPARLDVAPGACPAPTEAKDESCGCG